MGRCLLLALLGAMTVAVAAPWPPDGRLYVTLADAVPRVNAPGRVPLTLVLERRGGAWQPCFVSRIYRLDCPSVLTGTEEVGGEARLLRATVLITPDWRMGIDRTGYYRLAELDVRVSRGVDGAIAGTWAATEDGAPVGGTVTGELRGLTNGPCPPAPPLGEHPRFLLRAADLPALRAKAKTPWGQAMLKRLDAPDWSRSSSAVGLGLLYQITENREYADRARVLIEQDLDSGWWLPIGPIHDPAHKVTEAVMAYDLIYDACPPAFRAKMRRAFRAHISHLYDYWNIRAGNDHDYSNWNANFRAGVGMLALALVADPGDAPEPLPTGAIPRIAPAANPPREGAPVWTLDASLPFSRWLFAGPLNIGLGHDGLAALGGEAAARPVVGTPFAVTMKATLPQPALDAAAMGRLPNSAVSGDDLQPLTKATTAAFAPLGNAFLVGATTPKAKPEEHGKVDLWEAAGRRNFQTMYLYSVLEVPTETVVRVRMNTPQVVDPRVYISGVRVTPAECARLVPGRHPILVPLTMTTAVNAHDRTYQWLDLTLKAVPADVVAREERHLQAIRAYEVACRDAYTHTYGDGPSPDLEGLRWLPIARFRMANWNDVAIGDRGWNTGGEGYTQHCLRTALPFAHAFRNATGTDVSDRTNLGWVLPQATARTVFSPDWARMHSYGPGAGPLGVDLYARGFGLVPPALKPAVTWAWTRTQALADAGKFKAQDRLMDILDPMSTAFAFVNWPGEDAARDPGRLLPRVVVDHQRGGYTFRNRWQDAEDCVALLTLNRSPGGDWGDNCAGEFRFQGLGVEWTVRGMGSGCAPNLFTDRTRALPEKPGGNPVGTETAVSSSPDGSGVVAATLDGLTSDGKPVRAVRSFAVDYSGASGAPALLAVADRLMPTDADTPLPRCTWQFVTVADNAVTVDATGFTITAPNGAVMRATVVSPAAPAITVEPKSLKHEYNYRGDHWNGFYPRKVISVKGDGAFFVVFTVSKDAPPAVTVVGAGLDATATVGRRNVRFDGKTLVMADTDR